MNHFVFFDGKEREQLLPLTYLRPTSRCMVGMKTIEEQWHHLHGGNYSHLTPSYLQALYPYEPDTEVVTFVNGGCLPNTTLISQIDQLSSSEALYNKSNQLVAFKAPASRLTSREDLKTYISDLSQVRCEALVLAYPEDILKYSTDSYIEQYGAISDTLISATLDETNRVIGSDLYVGKDTSVTCAIINTTEGPVYIDDRVIIMEGAVIKGPVYLGPGTRIHVGAQVYAGTILGPECRIGGEIKRTTMFGYCNKAHGGYLGDSVLAKWCNLGAATNNSNMKNTYGKVNLWDISTNQKRKTDHQFLGSILGDHTMTAIQTSLNTGTLTGVFSCLLDRAPKTYMPSFSWGNHDRYDIEKAVEVARHAMSRRSIDMPEAYAQALHHLSDER